MMAEGEKEAYEQAIEILEKEYQKSIDEAKELHGFDPQYATWIPNEPLFNAIQHLKGCGGFLP